MNQWAGSAASTGSLLQLFADAVRRAPTAKGTLNFKNKFRRGIPARRRKPCRTSERGSRIFGACRICMDSSAGGRLGIRDTTSPLHNPPDVQRILERDLKQRVIPVLGEENVHVRVIASWGRVDVPLIQIASESQADLVVVGTHQRQGLSRFWLGSVSRAILHHAPESVAVVPPHATNEEDTGHIPELKRVLVTTDFSELGNRAIPYAYALLHRGGNLCILHVAASSAKTTGTAQAKEHDPVKRQLHCLIPAEAELRGIETQLEVVEHGEPAAAICQAAERFGADVTCMASHGRSGLSKTILGSVAHDVMTCSKRPLLVVRPPEK